MQSLSEVQINRQDFVDNEIYDLVKRLVTSTKEIERNIEVIADRQVPRKPPPCRRGQGSQFERYFFPGKPPAYGRELHIRDTIQRWLVDKYKIVGGLEFYPQE
jgi:hypothetical protein